MVVECLILSLVLHICISYVLFLFQLCFLSYAILELSRIAVLDTIDFFHLKNRKAKGIDLSIMSNKAHFALIFMYTYV